MKFIYSIIILSLLTPLSSWSQEVLPCYQAEMLREEMAKNPNLVHEMAEIEKQVKKAVSANSKITDQKSGDPYVVPVVVHVVYDDEVSNISDEQVRSGIDYLNTVYRKENDDSLFIDENFRAIYQDIGVEFRLATLDPNGNCTNGIMRYKDERSEGAGNNVKQGRQWPATKYLNIYTVASIGSGAAGYAYIPGTTNGNNDGIVILSSYTGTTGTSSKRRCATLIHEVGHYLGLWHTWGKSNSPGLASNCNDDDEVEDTPNTIGHTSCDIGAVTCGTLDNVQNYMEYANCAPEMLTAGQRERIFGFIDANVSGRGNLVSAQNLAATGTDYVRGEYPEVLCKVLFDKEDRLFICPGDSISFLDRSYFEVDSWEWIFEGAEPQISTERNPKVKYTEAGTYDVTLKVTKSGLSQEITKEKYVKVLGEMPPLPILDEFTDPMLLDPVSGSYVLFNEDEGITWETNSTSGYNDDNSLYLRARYANGSTEDNFTSQIISISGLDKPTLEFAYAHAYRQFSDVDKLSVLISTDCGQSFSVLRTLQKFSLKTADDDPSGEFVPSSPEEWKLFQYDLSPYKDQDVLIRISYQHGGGNNIYIDRMRIDEFQAVGLEEKSVLTQVNLWPNPAKGEVFIEGISKEEIAFVEVSDMAGRTFLAQITPLNSYMRVGLADLSSGIYVFKVQDRKGNQKIFKTTIIN